ncbi:MAG: toprim domain-containing protein [Raineya sp.]|jgi:hypothetical protein|nr:toprim domain-containing protein [Raineya sp.]
MRTFTDSELKKAKNYPISEILKQNAFEPIKAGNRTTFYFSPFRNEKTPSFAVYPNTNTFFDFGTGLGGDVIKLVCELQKITFIEAIKMLRENETFFFISPTSTKEEKDNFLSIESIKNLSNSYFLKYIEKRKIDIAIAQKYLKEIYYKTSPSQKKNFFGIGMENQSKGFEVKNCQTEQYYCLGSKDVTIIENLTFQSWSIFESMFDFLASLTFFQKPIQSNVIILHSVSMIASILEIPHPNTDKIYLFLDNDKAGNKATQELTNHFSQFFKVFDCRYLFAENKDFNEKLF